MLKHLDTFLIPEWVRRSWSIHTISGTTEEQLYAEIRWGLQRLQSNSPVVSIVIPAWNEERTIARTLYTLSRLTTRIPAELIVVNNNSGDRTQEILDACGVRSIMERRQGIAQARQTGLLAARGAYILSGDADTLYPEHWVDVMMEALTQENVAAVWGRHSFVPTDTTNRASFALYESIKQLLYRFRGITRPYLNAMGANVGYKKEIAYRVGGYDVTARRGSDGRLAMAMFPYGRIVAVRSPRATVWTDARRFQSDNGMLRAILKRMMKELPRMAEYLGVTKRDFTKLAGFRSNAAPLGQE